MSSGGKNMPTKEQIEALEALRLKTYGESSSKYIKFEDSVPITIAFTDWSKKNENGDYVNMWEEENEGDSGTYKTAVFKVLDITNDEKQEEKLLSVSSKKLFGQIQRLLMRGFVIIEITKHKGSTQYDTVFDCLPVGGEKK